MTCLNVVLYSVKNKISELLDSFKTVENKSREHRNLYWSQIRKLSEEYQWHVGFTFTNWVELTYGIQLILDRDGNITRDYNIVNESKYSFFLLKFS